MWPAKREFFRVVSDGKLSTGGSSRPAPAFATCSASDRGKMPAMGERRATAHAAPGAAGMRSGLGSRCWPALWATWAIAGCGTSVSHTYINGPQGTSTPRSPGSVRIYASGPPARPYRDVALLEARQSHGLNEQGMDLMLDRLRARAAQLGCDGVVVGGIRERSGSPPGSGFYLLDPGATTLHGTCIVFGDETSASLSPSRPPPPATPPAPGKDQAPAGASGCSCGAR